ncbi:hypothetical protein [Agathobacter sp.]
MSEKIVRGYWDCPYCSSKDIDGLKDYCPNCGVHKPKDVKYHLKGDISTEETYSKSQVAEEDNLTKEELSKAGISEEECDGNHKEWVCDFCGSLNNWADDTCASCGAQREDAEFEYGGEKRGQQDTSAAQNTIHKTELVQEQQHDTSMDSKPEKKSFFKRKKKTLIATAVVMAILAVVTVLFFPYKNKVTVDGFSWERNIALEEYKTVQESDWSVPSGGRVYDERTEIKSYVSVVDHYETVWETKTREVYDHDETTTTYTDNGNGTFTENTTSTPVYRTETYQESHEEPVYRQDPVYATKYYYDIDKWVDTGKDYPSSGDDHEPYWNEDYKPLEENFRDTDRTEKYVVHFDNNKSDERDFDEWNALQIGDAKEQTTCLLGIIYSEKDL